MICLPVARQQAGNYLNPKAIPSFVGKAFSFSSALPIYSYALCRSAAKQQVVS
jgi:hypothetical protein